MNEDREEREGERDFEKQTNGTLNDWMDKNYCLPK